jgi:hypothetical protein
MPVGIASLYAFDAMPGRFGLTIRQTQRTGTFALRRDITLKYDDSQSARCGGSSTNQ